MSQQDLLLEGEDEFEALPRLGQGLMFAYDSFAYTHTMLVVSQHLPQSSSVYSTLLYWNHCFPGQTSKITMDIPIESLKAVEGYKALGKFEIPASLDHQFDDTVEIIIFQLQEKYRDPSALDLQAIEGAVGSDTPKSDQHVSFHTINVSSSVENTIFSGEDSIWTFAKPTSPYGFLTGFWEGTAKEAIVAGEWGAGKDIN